MPVEEDFLLTHLNLGAVELYPLDLKSTVLREVDLLLVLLHNLDELLLFAD